MIYPTTIFIWAHLFMCWKEHQKLYCLNCGAQTIKVNNDTLQLSSGEQVECQLGSCTCESRSCPKCHTMKNIRRFIVSSSFVPCSSCGHRTAVHTNTTPVQPTYNRPGTSVVQETCKHCRKTNRYENIIPPLIKDAMESIIRVSSKVDTSSDTSSPSRSMGSSSPSSETKLSRMLYQYTTLEVCVVAIFVLELRQV